MVSLMPGLSPAAVAQFQADGYCLQPAVFTPAEVQVLRVELARVLKGGTGKAFFQEAWEPTERKHGFFPVQDLAGQSDAYRAICHGVLLAQAEQLLGEPVELYEALGIVKPPRLGQTFPLHQDGAYYGPVDGRYVIANVYLDDVTAENGSLRLAPGSHRTYVPHEDHAADGGKKTLPATAFPVLVEPQAKAGDVVWFHLWTVHGSGPNHSRAYRRSVRAGYVAVSA